MKPGSEKKGAWAVGYDPDDPAPRLLAAGRGRLAETILRLAAEEGIPVESDPDLALVLDALSPGQLIPEELYQAFALILARLYEVNGKKRPG
jgi:flagellar biosynthesis protein